MTYRKKFKYFSLSSVLFWLALFTLVPLALMIIVSFMSSNDNQLIIWHFDIHNYTSLFNIIYLKIFWRSLWLATICTLFCLILGYPIAYIIAHARQHVKNLLLIFLIIPFWTSSLIRTYALLALIKTKGIINAVLLKIGIIHMPLTMLYTTGAVLLGCVYNLLPFMILPLYANLEKMDLRLVEAAQDLGANRFQIFTRIIFPLSIPGVIAGVLLVLLPAMTLFYIPILLGSAKSLLLGNLIQSQFLLMRNWPQGAATSVTLTLLMFLLVWFYRRKTKGKHDELLA